MSQEEKRETLRNIRETVNEWPRIPYYKSAGQVDYGLSQGNTDFIADVHYWQGQNARYWGIVRPVKPWHRAEHGFHIRARSIDKVVQTVNAIIADHRDTEFIYFRCASPEMPFPRTYNVEEEMQIFEALENELLAPGTDVRRDLYDR